MRRKEARRGKCNKCGKVFYVHAHHIFPKEQHGKEGEVANLCPNCHTHIHEHMNKHLKDPTDKEEIWRVWEHWLYKVPVTWMLIIGLLSALWWVSG